MTWTYIVHDGNSPSAMAPKRSWRWWSGEVPASVSPSSCVRNSLPWSVLKVYLTQTFSPAALIHWKVWEP